MSRRTQDEARTREVERRLDAMRRALRERHADVMPDPGFAARVVAGLDRPATELVGIVALRCLPAALALALALGCAVTWTALSDDGARRASQVARASTTGEARSPEASLDWIGWALDDPAAGEAP